MREHWNFEHAESIISDLHKGLFYDVAYTSSSSQAYFDEYVSVVLTAPSNCV